MNLCRICQAPLVGRSTKRYCSQQCRYRSAADKRGRKRYVPAVLRGADGATYASIHSRLTMAFGAARSHQCVRCTSNAAEWAYDHSDKNALIDPTSGLEFSSDLSRYQPMCRRCHCEFDNAANGRQAKCGTRAGYDRHRRVTNTPPCQPCKDAIAAIARKKSVVNYEERPA